MTASFFVSISPLTNLNLIMKFVRGKIHSERLVVIGNKLTHTQTLTPVNKGQLLNISTKQ